MIYYRVAFQRKQEPLWKWQSTALTSLHALFGFLSTYGRNQEERLRVFFSSSPDLLEEMLVRENQGLPSTSCPATHVLRECRRIPVEEMHRLEGALARPETPRVLSQREKPQQSWNGQQQLVAETTCPIPEEGPGGDHDLPYVFIPAISQKQALAWVKLLGQVSRGELHP
jgi:hypothetical protein